MSTPADDIIIKGGSVEIEFNERSFPGQDGKHSNKDKRIVSVNVADHNTNQTHCHASREWKMHDQNYD
jgi:hypothetical protein